MPGRYLSDKVKLTKVSNAVTAATTAVNATSVDMQNYEGVLFLASFGTAATGNTINAAVNDDGSTTFTDLSGSSVSVASSDEDVWLDVYRPAERYIRAEFVRGTSTTIENVWAIQYGPRSEPVDNETAGTIAGEQHLRPSTGTA